MHKLYKKYLDWRIEGIKRDAKKIGERISQCHGEIDRLKEGDMGFLQFLNCLYTIHEKDMLCERYFNLRGKQFKLKDKLNWGEILENAAN
jgi:uncharacterized protein Smg (DUF494 family)